MKNIIYALRKDVKVFIGLVDNENFYITAYGKHITLPVKDLKL